MNNKLHNTKIYIDHSNYKNILKNSIKKRDNYLDKDDIKYYEEQLLNKNKILFLSNDVNEPNPYFHYNLTLHGILPCGSKTTVIINKIYPYIDLLYNTNKSKEENLKYIKELCKHQYLKQLLKGKFINIHSVELNEGKEFMLFSENKSKFIRIYFNTINHRINFIKLLKYLNIKSFNNNENHYYRTVSSKYNINLAGWNELTNYTIKKDNRYKSSYVIYVDKQDINLCNNEHYIQNGYDEKYIDLFRNEKIISMCFDIEQFCNAYDPLHPEIKTFPSGKLKEDIVFNISMTYQFINSTNSFLNINLLTKEANIHNEYFTIICSDEIVLIKSFAFINNLLLPDFIIEFNGSAYDWVVLYDKCMLYDIYNEFCTYMSIKTIDQYTLDNGNLKYNYQKRQFKVSAESSMRIMCNIKMEGYIPFDLRLILMKLNPKASKSSLNFYLGLYNLPNKDNMPIPKLFKIYMEDDINGMTDVAHYCYIDSFSLHRLVYQNNIIQDNREISIISYCSLADSFYYADSCKVENLILYNAINNNLFINNIVSEVKDEDKKKGKFPGAFVLYPKKGLINNIMNIKEFMENRLDIYDKDLINQAQQIISDNYDDFYIKKNIDNINL